MEQQTGDAFAKTVCIASLAVVAASFGSGITAQTAPPNAMPKEAAPYATRSRVVPWESEPAEPDPVPFVDWGIGRGQLLVGSASANGTHSLQATFAVRQLQKGKRDEGKWERWKLYCSDRDSSNCWLDRLRIETSDLEMGGPLMWEDHLNTVENTISNLKMDWKNGIVSFSFSLTPQRPDLAPATQVEIMVTQAHGSLYLKSFHAVGWGRDKDANLVSFDYGIPNNTVTLNVPLVMPGLRSVGQKHWDDMLKTLSVGDQKVWRELAAHPGEFSPDDKRTTEKVQAALPQIDWSSTAGSFTPEQAAIMNRVLADEHFAAFRQRLAQSSMSAAGQRTVLAYLEGSRSGRGSAAAAKVKNW